MSSLEASESYGSGTSGGPGFGNKTTDNDTTYDNSDTRFGTRENTDSYSGGTEYGSGTTAGVGFGNKSAIESGYSQEHDATRYGSARDTGAYAGGTEYGSGATSGPGFGNKTSGNGGGSDGIHANVDPCVRRLHLLM